MEADLVSFVQTCSEYFAYSCLQKHIRFKTTIEGRNLEDVLDGNEKPLIFVLSEVDALEKVIFNLLSNALKFTPDGGEIELGIQSVDNHARVFVTDTGPGIQEEDQELGQQQHQRWVTRLFRKFVSIFWYCWVKNQIFVW